MYEGDACTCLRSIWLDDGCTVGKPVRTPDAGAFWRVVAEHRVNNWFCAPTAFRAIKKEDPKGELIKKYDLSCLRGQRSRQC